jgi:hypothetical protein
MSMTLEIPRPLDEELPGTLSGKVCLLASWPLLLYVRHALLSEEDSILVRERRLCHRIRPGAAMKGTQDVRALCGLSMGWSPIVLDSSTPAGTRHPS